jgi:hypothetical protein
MKKMPWLIVAAVLVITLVLFRYGSRLDLNVEPHAREVIEKALQR